MFFLFSHDNLNSTILSTWWAWPRYSSFNYYFHSLNILILHLPLLSLPLARLPCFCSPPLALSPFLSQIRELRIFWDRSLEWMESTTSPSATASCTTRAFLLIPIPNMVCYKEEEEGEEEIGMIGMIGVWGRECGSESCKRRRTKLNRCREIDHSKYRIHLLLPLPLLPLFFLSFLESPSFGCPNTKTYNPKLDFSCQSMIYKSQMNQSLINPIGSIYLYSDLKYSLPPSLPRLSYLPSHSSCSLLLCLPLPLLC